MKRCMKCGKIYGEVAAISRVDGSEICRSCSEKEALEAAVEAGAITLEQMEQAIYVLLEIAK